VDGAVVVEEQLWDNHEAIEPTVMPFERSPAEPNADQPLTVAARHRRHQFPGRSRAIKVLYDEQEYAGVQQAATAVGLTTTGFVAAAGLQLADPAAPARHGGQDLDRAVLTELLAARTALRRYGVNVNQAVAALNSGVGAPIWLQQAVAGCDRAVGGVDDVTLLLARRLR
jgi:hypothetical protein